MSDQVIRNVPGDRLYVWTIVGLGLLYLLPVLLTAHLPMQDIPIHLAIIDTLARTGDPAWTEHFVADIAPRPYVTYYAAALIIAPWLGTEGANRLLLAIYIAAFIAAAGFLQSCRYARTRSGRDDRWSVLLYLPFVYSDFYLVGLTNFLLSMPLLMFSAGVCIKLCGGRARRWLNAAALGLIALLLCFTHPVTLCYLLLLAAGTALRARVWNDRWTLALGLLPATILLFLFVDQTAGFGTSPVWPPVEFKIRYLMMTPLIFVDAVDRSIFLLCAVLFATLLAAGLYRAYRAYRACRLESVSLRAAVCKHDGSLVVIGVAVVAFAVSPGILGSTVWFDARFAYLAWLALLYALGRHLLRRRIEKLAAIALGVACLSAVQLGHLRFDQEIEPLFEIIEETPQDARLFPVTFDPASGAVEPFYVRSGDLSWFSLYAQAGTYYHLHRGGVSPFMTFYAGLPWLPLRLKDAIYEQAFTIADPFVPAKLLARLPALQEHFDLVLARGLTRQAAVFLQPLALPVVQRGPFTLLVMKHRLPRPEATAAEEHGEQADR